MKTNPSKTKNFIMNVYPHHPFYQISILKRKNESFATQKSLRVLKLLRVLLGFFFRFHNARVLFMFLSDRVLLISSVIGSSSGSSVIDPSLGSSVLFFQHATIFFQNMLLVFLFKKDVLFYIIFSKRTSHLIINSEKNEEILA